MDLWSSTGPSTEPKSSFCIQGIVIGGISSSDLGLWCSLWNSLPVDIKNAQSLFIVKKKLKTFLFNQLHS